MIFRMNNVCTRATGGLSGPSTARAENGPHVFAHCSGGLLYTGLVAMFQVDINEAIEGRITETFSRSDSCPAAMPS